MCIEVPKENDSNNHNTLKKKYILNTFLKKESSYIPQNEIHCIEVVKKNDTEIKGSNTSIKVLKKNDTKKKRVRLW